MTGGKWADIWLRGATSTIRSTIGPKMKTYSARAREIEKKWVLIDAEGLVVGRLATIIANRLRGKHKPSFTPHRWTVATTSSSSTAEKVAFSGNKRQDKTYYWHTGYPGGIKERKAHQILDGKFPERVLEAAVKRMLPGAVPQAPADDQSAHLQGSAHPHEAQNPSQARYRRHEPQERPERLSAWLRPTDTLEILGAAMGMAVPHAAAPVAPAKPKLDAKGRAYATGRRKNAVARVWIKRGAGKITVNGKVIELISPARCCACWFSSR